MTITIGTKDTMTITIGTKLKHVGYCGSIRVVTAVLPDGRFELSTEDPRTKSGVRKTKAKLATIEREYEIVG